MKKKSPAPGGIQIHAFLSRGVCSTTVPQPLPWQEGGEVCHRSSCRRSSCPDWVVVVGVGGRRLNRNELNSYKLFPTWVTKVEVPEENKNPNDKNFRLQKKSAKTLLVKIRKQDDYFSANVTFSAEQSGCKWLNVVGKLSVFFVEGGAVAELSMALLIERKFYARRSRVF